MNSFTDASPQFPYQSREASEQLGLPESSEIHLAITRVAELILPLADESAIEERLHRIVALRVASGAVLFGWPLEAAKQEARQALELPLATNQPLPAPWITNDYDWLAEAADQLRSEGFVVKPNYQRHRSNYGWVELPRSNGEASTEA